MSYLKTALSIPASEQSKLQNLFDDSLCPMEYGLGDDRNCLSVTQFDLVNLQGIDVMRDEGSGHRQGIRKLCHIQENPSDDFLIPLPTDAQVRLMQSGIQAKLDAGSFSFLSTAKPFTATIFAKQRNGVFSHTIARVSGPLLRQRIPHIDSLCSLPIKIRPGSGHIMQTLLNTALDEGSELTEQQASHFSTTLIDYIAEATLSAPEANIISPAMTESAKTRLLEKAQHYILTHLSDSELNAESTAQFCNVSVRYLRSAFTDSPFTISEFIREARLQQCRKALQSEALKKQSIIDIAMRWGFNDAAYFSRAYRARFGIPPSQERQKN